MWAASLTPVGPYFPALTPNKPTKYQPLNHFPTDVAVNPRFSVKAAAKQDDDDGKEISGSDVLWALQRAAAKKKKNSNSKRKKKGLASSSSQASQSQREKDAIDYTDDRPLEIKTEWSLKLDELEKRLQELEEEYNCN